MNINRSIVRRVLVVIGVLVLIPVFALGALAVSARNSDGGSRVFSGGPLVAGELVRGAEPDWSFVREIRNIQLQLLDPPRSRILWIVEDQGKIYLNSNYMLELVSDPTPKVEEGRVLGAVVLIVLFVRRKKEGCWDGWRNEMPGYPACRRVRSMSASSCASGGRVR